MGARAPTPITVLSTRLNTFIATREEEGPFVMTNGCRTASVTSSPRRTKRPSTLTVGKVGWSVERETWCRLTLERQPSAGAGLALHQSRISMREIRASQTLDLLWQTHGDANRTKGGLKISRAPASSGKTGPPAPRAPTRGGRGGYKAPKQQQQQQQPRCQKTALRARSPSTALPDDGTPHGDSSPIDPTVSAHPMTARDGRKDARTTTALPWPLAA